MFDDDRGYGYSYIWNPDTVIGSNNFSFPLRTYIQLEFKAHLIEVNSALLIEKYVSEELQECSCLFDKEYSTLLQCLLKSKYLKNKYKRSLEAKVQSLVSTAQ